MEQAIRRAESPEELEAVRGLVREYAETLDVDLETQNLTQELAELPGKYAPPTGCLLLATVDGQPAGCIAMKRLSDGICEMKRLYVRPQYRALKLGRRLAERLIEESRTAGYAFMRLDTMPERMGRADALYRTLGFERIEPYWNNVFPGTVYMELKL